MDFLALKGNSNIYCLNRIKLMPALIICKVDEDPIKTEYAGLETWFFHYKSMGKFFST